MKIFRRKDKGDLKPNKIIEEPNCIQEDKVLLRKATKEQNKEVLKF